MKYTDGGKAMKRVGYSDKTTRLAESLQSSAMCTTRVASPREVPDWVPYNTSMSCFVLCSVKKIKIKIKNK
jgi:hypothetical protein